MQDKCELLVAPKHHTGDVDGAVVHEPSPRVDRLDALTAAVMSAPQVEVPVEVDFVGEAYIRAGWIKAGTVVVGYILNEAVPLVLLKGEAMIAGAEGTVKVTAPYVGVNEPGTRRALYAITDCYALNAVFTEVQDKAVVERRIIGEQACLESQQQQQSLSLE